MNTATACEEMCERSAMAHQHRCAFVLTVILALLALTGPASAADGPCTEQQFMSVATAADPTPVVMGMMGSAPACATCFIGCATKTGAEKAACGMACSSAAVASTNDAAASPTSVPAEPAAEEAATTSATSVPAEPAAEEAATTSASECKDSPDEVVNVASGTRPSTFSIPVLEVPFVGDRWPAPQLRSWQGTVRRGPPHPTGLSSHVWSLQAAGVQRFPGRGGERRFGYVRAFIFYVLAATQVALAMEVKVIACRWLASQLRSWQGSVWRGSTHPTGLPKDVRCVC